APPLEDDVVDLIDGSTQRIEHRQKDDRRQDRIGAVTLVQDVDEIGAENDEGGMRDIDDVEHAKGNRDAYGHRGIKAAEQNPGDDRAQQQLSGNPHPALILPWCWRFAGQLPTPPLRYGGALQHISEEDHPVSSSLRKQGPRASDGTFATLDSRF